MERKRLRLRNFDYGDPGPYFVTVTLQNRQPIFGTIRDATLLQTAIGCLVESTWLTMSDRFDGVELDDFIVMPDHIHGILILPTNGKTKLGTVLQAFKSITTVEYGRGVESFNWPRYERRLWQRDYWEHVIRIERDLNEKRSYIQGNPARWG